MSGSIFLQRVEWQRVGSNSVEIIDDVISLQPRKGMEVKNNIFDLRVKNTLRQTSGGQVVGRYVNADGSLQFRERDILRVYAKFTNSASDVNGEWWTNDFLIGVFFVREFQFDHSDNSTHLTISGVDNAFILFNRVWAKEYGRARPFTAPGIIRNMVRFNSGDTISLYPGTQNEIGQFFDIQANFESEGGFIQDRRSTNTTLTGSVSAGDTTINVVSTAAFQPVGTLVIGDEHISYAGKTSTSFTGCVRGIDDTIAKTHASGTVYQGFPLIQIANTFRPVYEWLAELSQTGYTNYVDELRASEPFYPLAFILWMDKFNRLVWRAASDIPDLTITVDGNQEVYGVRMERTVFDSVNFVIYNSGNDMNGRGITYYFYNPDTQVPTLKMRYEPMIDIADYLLNEDLKANPNREAEPANEQLRRYPVSFPLSNWAFKASGNDFRDLLGQTPRSTLTSKSDYNNALREASRWDGRVRAQQIVSRTVGLRYRGDIVVKYANYAPGTLIRFTDRRLGINNQLLRIVDITPNLSRQECSVTLRVEEDEKRVFT